MHLTWLLPRKVVWAGHSRLGGVIEGQLCMIDEIRLDVASMMLPCCKVLEVMCRSSWMSHVNCFLTLMPPAFSARRTTCVSTTTYRTQSLSRGSVCLDLIMCPACLSPTLNNARVRGLRYGPQPRSNIPHKMYFWHSCNPFLPLGYCSNAQSLTLSRCSTRPSALFPDAEMLLPPF